VRGVAAPNLYGIAGTRSGEGSYAFSKALKDAKIKWDAETLDHFLAAPSKVAPGTRMVTPIPNERDRQDVVAFLLSLKN
jgi:cytochrome c